MYRDLTDKGYLKSILGKRGLKPKKSSGQNFLICEEVIEATLLTLNKMEKRVTELGAGMGVLTKALLESGYEVQAIERDKDLAEVLKKETKRLADNRLQVIVGDLKKVDWSWGDKSDKKAYQLVGYIPYNITGLIVRQITNLEPAPERVILLLQKEVGERLTAKPPKMGLSSLAVSLWGEARILMNVPASCFWPKPKVDSCLIMMARRDFGISDEERKRIMKMARVFFQAKRKQMGRTMRDQLGIDSRDKAVKILQKAEINEKSRPQELSVEQWRGLARVL